MQEAEQIKSEFKQFIKDNPASFPFLAPFWNIIVENKSELYTELLEFGKYNSQLPYSEQFYKPLSKIIDLFKMEEF